MLPILKIEDEDIKPKLVIIDGEEWVSIKLKEWEILVSFLSAKNKAAAGEADAKFIERALSEIKQTENEVTMVHLLDFQKRIASEDIKEEQQKKRISQKQLAKLAGVTQIQIQNIENNPTSISAKTFQKVAKALGIKIDL
jgi:ribosome-binding protein aMBF1 (putative translation factor)